MTLFLETQRLVIKTPTLSDFDNWCAIYAESEGNAISQENIKEWLSLHIADFKRNGFSMGSVFLKDTHEFIGRAGLFHYYSDEAKREVEIGYGLLNAYWGRGYATELVRALIDWAFDNLDINKLIALTTEDNIRSQRVLAKSGMHYVKKELSEGKEFLRYEIHKRAKGKNIKV